MLNALVCLWLLLVFKRI